MGCTRGLRGMNKGGASARDGELKNMILIPLLRGRRISCFCPPTIVSTPPPSRAAEVPAVPTETLVIENLRAVTGASAFETLNVQ